MCVNHHTSLTLSQVILEAFGTGNAPHDIPEFNHAIKSATDAGVIVVVVSTCNHSYVDLGAYEAGKFLRELGCVSGLDMTPEAAFTKLSWLLGLECYSTVEVDICVCVCVWHTELTRFPSM